QISAALSILFHPVLPAKMSQLRNQLGVPNTLRWDDVTSVLIPAGQIVEQGEILFEKIEDEAVQEQIGILESRAAESAGTSSKEYEPLKETATFDDFVKLDFRAGKITDAKKIKKSKKLLNITVDLGFEKRTILSGIAEFFKADEIIGRSVVVVANLAPKKMMGVESNGMILMGEDTEGKLYFVETDSEPGSPVM
ncbi:methionine--tRNA ligase subunit beta, partial [Rhodohalobacter sp.]|uniref:methionine--tRNA ligase subunit beta n=1 Tax=Rhodohalobacter sp. TaxID=1974210 RepID=UPI003561AADD